MKQIAIFTLVIFLMAACSPINVSVKIGEPTPTNTPLPTDTPRPTVTPTLRGRAEMVAFGKSIGDLERKRVVLSNDMDRWYDKTKGSIISDAQINEYKDFVNRSLALLNEINKIDRPREAREVYDEFVEAYGKAYDADRFYLEITKQGEPSLYERYVTAHREGNRMIGKAYDDFWSLMEHYSIYCSEIKMCKTDFATPTPVADGPSGVPLDVTVTTTEFKFDPPDINAAPGQTIDLKVKNSGSIQHTWVLQAANVKLTIEPGQTVTKTFTAPATGTYVTECDIPGHKESGMVGQLVVK